MAGVVFSKSSGVTDSIFGKSQEPIKALIEEKVEAFQNGRSMVDKVFVVENTQNFAEKFTSETALGNFDPVGEAGAYPENTVREGYATVITPDTWKNSFEITMEMLEDSNWSNVKKKAHAFTLSYNRTREMFAAAMLMGGKDGSIAFGSKQKVFSAKAADGENFFSTGHPSVTGGYDVQSNYFDGAFNYDNLCYVQERMQNFRDDDGNLLGVSPDTIIIPNDAMLKKAVFNAMGAEGLPEDANNSFNFQYGLWNVIVWPYLNQFMGGDKPFILCDREFNEAYYGAIWLDRIGLNVRSELAENDNNVFRGRARHNAGFNDWRAFAMCFDGSGGTAL